MKDTDKQTHTTKPERRVPASLVERIQPMRLASTAGRKATLLPSRPAVLPSQVDDQPISSPARFSGAQLARGRLPAHRSAIDGIPDFAIVQTIFMQA